jgi:hypothetical protein
MKIQPCPFCGADTGIEAAGFGDSQEIFFRVKCTGYDGHSLDCWDSTKEDAIRSWNGISYWNPIESVPKDGTEVLLWLGEPFSRVEKARYYPPWGNWQVVEIPINPEYEEEIYGIGSAVPTHWMKLPDGP